MERTKTRSTRAVANAKKKMTREQMQIALVKKKECDARALKIVEQLLEPNIDQAWLVENLQHINKCHMEDAIEERAITRICGYVLCQKPLTAIIKQQYHISLRDKKVYDVSKRKNFCSSSCFGASNYLLEQMLTSPLWMRDKEEIPVFRVLKKGVPVPKDRHGEVVDINLIEHCKKDEEDEKNDESAEENSVDERSENQKEKMEESTEKEVLGNVEDFVLETIKNVDINGLQEQFKESETKIDSTSEEKLKDENKNVSAVVESSSNKNEVLVKQQVNTEEEDEEDIIQQVVYPVKTSEEDQTASENVDDDDVIEQYNYFIDNKSNKISAETSPKRTTIVQNDIISENKKEESSKPASAVDSATDKKEKIETKKPKAPKKKKTAEQNIPIDVNLAARIEKSFQEWVTEETINFLFGDDTVKQKAIEKIDFQDKYSMLCEKLNRLQYEDEKEDATVLEKPVLKPAPHFAVLKEEGQKLDIKVRAFYEGKTTFEELKNSEVENENLDLDTFLPLTDVHAPQTLRRKIFLERLDQVLPDLLRTLAGNNEVYARTCCNYISLRCTAVKALVHTFSLSATNIIFKTAEWTLVSLVIIKMLSLLDPWLATLLLTKQANMYISMILTSYKLDPHYLNLFVASFNPNMNPK